MVSMTAVVLAVLSFTWTAADTPEDPLVYTEIRRLPLSAPLNSNQYDPSFSFRIDAASCPWSKLKCRGGTRNGRACTLTSECSGGGTCVGVERLCKWTPNPAEKDWIYQETRYWRSGRTEMSREVHVTCEDPTGSGCPQAIFGVPAVSGGGAGTCASPLVLPSQGGTFTGTTGLLAASALDGTCSGTGAFKAPEIVYRWTPGSTQQVEVKLCGSSYDTVVYIRNGSCIGPELACNDDDVGAIHCLDYHHSYLLFQANAGTAYFIVVDGYNSNTSMKKGAYTLTITPVAMRETQ